MTENAEKWMELVSRSRELQEKLMAMSSKTRDEAQRKVIALAQEYGICLTAGDFAPPPSEELSDDELDSVAGGGGWCCAGWGCGVSQAGCTGQGLMNFICPAGGDTGKQV